MTNIRSMIEFYESQLIGLTAFCLLTLAVERYLSQSNRKKLSQDLGGDETGSLKGRGLLAALTRQYLVVYAIVMGECYAFSSSKNVSIYVPLQGPIGYRDHTSILSIENNIDIQRDSSRFYSSLALFRLAWRRH